MASKAKAKNLAEVLGDALMERDYEVDFVEGATDDVFVAVFGGAGKKKDYFGNFRVTPSGNILSIGKPAAAVIRAIKDAGLGDRVQEDSPRTVQIYYGLITPESAEAGDFADRGEENVYEIDPSFDETYVTATVKFLQDEGAQDSGGGDWFSRTTDPDFRTRNVTDYDYFLKGFEPKEEEEIWRAMTRGRRGRTHR